MHVRVWSMQLYTIRVDFLVQSVTALSCPQLLTIRMDNIILFIEQIQIHVVICKPEDFFALQR